MKRARIRSTVAIVGLMGVLAGIALAAQDRYALEVPGGLAFADFRGYENWQTIAVSHNGDKVALIVGNPAMIEAYQSGIPGNGKPFPDGARMAKTHWMAKKAEDQPGEPVVPGALHDVDFMVKDSKKFADSGGWGWAEFEYDVASETFRPATHRTSRRRSTTQSAGSPATRSWRRKTTFSPPTRSGDGGDKGARKCRQRTSRGKPLFGRSSPRTSTGSRFPRFRRRFGSPLSSASPRSPGPM